MTFPDEDDLVFPPPSPLPLLPPLSSAAAASGGGQTSSGDHEVSTTSIISYDNYYYYYPRNPDNPPPLLPPPEDSISPPPPPPPAPWLLPDDFYDGVENDDVDTTLRLCPPGTLFPFPPMVYNPTPLQCIRPHAAAAPNIKKPRNSNKREKGKGIRPPKDANGAGDLKKRKTRFDEVESSAAAGNRVSAGDESIKKTRLDDAETSAAAGDEKKAAAAAEKEYEDQKGKMFRAVESFGGSKPEFLYKKKLVTADVKKDQNRVFLTRAERVMEFLREEEAAAVYAGGKGVRIVGVDGRGNVYKNLVMKKWGSLEMIVLNSDWNRVVSANRVRKDDVMEIWGFRDQSGKSCFAFIFRR